MRDSPDAPPLRVELDRRGAFYAPGHALRARVILAAGQELALRGVRARFVRRVQYLFKRSSMDRGDSFVTDTGEEELDGETVSGAQVIPAGQTRSWDLGMTVPPDAPPSHFGEIIRLEYFVGASAERAHAPDLRAQIPLIVTAPWQAAVEQAEEDGEEDAVNTTELEEGTFAFELERDGYREGETLAGIFRVTPARELEVTGVALELVCAESVTRELGNSGTISLAQLPLAGKMQFRRATTTQFPFRLEIPVSNLPDFETEDAASYTVLQAKLARPLKPDIRVEGYFALYSAPEPNDA